MTPTPPLSIALFLVAAVLGAVGQFLYKSGADVATSGIAGYLLNVRLLLGVLCYGAVMVLFVAAFKSGGSLAVLYPVYASTFIFAAIISRFAYGHPILPIHVLGWVLLIGGMSLMGWQSSSADSLDPTTATMRDKRDGQYVE